MNEGEEGYAKVAEYEGFHCICHHLEGDRCDSLGLIREVIPSVFGHHYTGHKQCDNAWIVEQFSDTITDVPENEHQVDLDHGHSSQEAEFFQNKGAQNTEEQADGDWEEAEKDETV